MWDDDVDRVMRDDYLGELTTRPIEEIRSMRVECRQIEDKVSYFRRLIQGRLDIVAADLRRRSDGGSPTDLATLVEQLPDILSDKISSPGPGRLPTGLVPPDDDDLTVELDQVAAPGALDRLAELSDEEEAELARRIGDLERKVSAVRKSLFSRIDALQAELVRRYGGGEADPGAVLD